MKRWELTTRLGLFGLLLNSLAQASEPTSLPPEITSTAPTSAQVGQLYTYQVDAVDPESGPLSYELYVLPTGMTISPAGLVSWIPTIAGAGEQTFKVTVRDQSGLEASQYVDLLVEDPSNNAPLINQEPATSFNIGDTYTYDLQASDADGDTLSYSVWSWPEAPGLSVSTQGILTWSPSNRDQAGVYWVSVEVNDGRLGKAKREFELSAINAANQAPVIGATPVTQTNTDTPYTYDLQATDADGDTLSYELTTWPSDLGVVLSDNGVLTWTPSRNNVGENWISIKVHDGHLGQDEIGYELNVIDPNNHNPVITSTPMTQATQGIEYVYAISVTDADSDAVTLSLFEAPAGMELNTITNTISWTPAQASAEGVGIKIDARDNYGGFARQEYTLIVNESGTTNNAPVAHDQSITTAEDVALTITLSASDPDSQALSYSILSQPLYGTLSGDSAQPVYTPQANFFGTDSFTFVASDGALSSNLATVSITVTSANDAPLANNITVQTSEDTALDVTLTGSDVDGDSLTYTVAVEPTHGSLSGIAPDLTYTPNTNFSGTDVFTYSVNDGAVSSGFATVSITVNAENDAPTAENVAVQTAEETDVELMLIGNDVDGDTLTYTVVSQAQNGTLSGIAPDLTYTPNTNFTGADSFTYRVNDGQLDSALATVSITISTVNDAPVAQDINQQINEDSASIISLLATDADQDTLTYHVLTQPQHGSLSGSGSELTYTPSLNYIGSDSFTYRANDGTADSNIAVVTITLLSVNDVPFAQNISTQTTEDTALALTLVGNDTDGDTLTYVIDTQPSQGVLSGSAPNLVYTPNANVSGTDTFTYHVNDGQVNSATATVTITVTPLNDSPVADSLSIQLFEDTPANITLQGSDPDGDSLTYTLVSQPQHGVLSGSGASLIYTPNANVNGLDSFTYTVSDGQSTSNIATVSLTIDNVNDAPVVQDLNLQTAEDTALSATLLGTDTDNDSLTYTVVSQPANGVLTGGAPNLTYTPNNNFTGSDSFTYRANDGQADSAIATVNINVTNTNDAPVTQNGSGTVNEDASLVLTLQATDPDADVLTFEITTQPQNGTLSGTGSEQTYTPNANYNGSDSFTYRANDGTANSNTAIMNITVNPVNDAPVANPANASTEANQPVNINLSASDIDGDVLAYSIATQAQNGTVTLADNVATYTPTTNFSGTDSFAFVANDGVVNSVAFTVQITVIQANSAPQITSTPVLVGSEGAAYSYQVTATDPDNDALTFALSNGPVDMVINSVTGLVEWVTPAEGEHSVEITVTDALGNSVQQIFNLTIVSTEPPVTYLGRDFWAMFNDNNGGFPDNAWLYIAAPEGASGTLEIPGLGFSQSFTVNANDVIVIRLDDQITQQLLSYSFDAIYNVGIHITADRDIALYLHNQIQSTTDATLILPTQALANHYMVSSYAINVPGLSVAGGSGRSLFSVLATEDNTVVRYVPKVDTTPSQFSVRSNFAGELVERVLNRGEMVQEIGRIPYADFSGTIIEADKPVAVFAGNQCTNVPGATLACDHLIEQVLPLNAWGSEYFTYPLATRVGGDTFRVLASADNTDIWVNDVLLHQLQRGEFRELTLEQPSHIRANRPVLVNQLSNSAHVDSSQRPNSWADADPFMVTVPAAEQFLREYIVTTAPTGVSDNYLNVIIPADAVNTLTLDGTLVDTGLFAPIANTGYVGAQLSVAVGAHHLQADQPFGLYVYGFDFFESYGYLGGMALTENTEIAQLQLTQTALQTAVGSEQCVTATVLSPSNTPIAQAQVTLEVTGQHPKVDTTLSNPAGQVEFCYRGVQVGLDQIQLLAGGQIAQVSIDWQTAVTPTDGSPRILSIPVVYVTPGETFSYVVEGVDPDGGLLNYSLNQSLSGMNIDSGSGEINWFVPGNFESAIVEVTVTDEQNLTASQVFQLSVNTPRHLPISILSTAPANVVAFNNYTYSVDVPSEPGNNNIAYSVEAFPDNALARFGINRYIPDNVLTWQMPTNEDVGPNEFVILASNGFGSVQRQTFTVNVIPNQGPQFTSTPLLQASVGLHYQYDITVEDPEGDELLVGYLNQRPAGMTLGRDGHAYQLNWTPTAAQVGVHQIEFEFLDVNYVSNTQVFEIIVVDNNAAPVITSTAIAAGVAGQEYRYTLSATDSDNDPINYTLLSSPTGMSISSGDTLVWQAQISDIGDHAIRIRADDGKGGTDYQSFTLNVASDNQAPVITSLPLTAPIAVEENFTYSVQASDPDPADSLTYQLAVGPAEMTIDDTGLVQWQPVAADIGVHTITLSVSDGSLSATQTFDLTVGDTADTTTPVVSLSQPLNNSLVTAPTQVVGSIDDTNIASWRLLYAKQNTVNFVTLAEGTTNLSEQTLATFDPTLLDNGQYVIVLEASDINAQTTQAVAYVTVEGDLKVGNFSFTVEDINVPLAGLPIRVTRTYDSRRKNEALDFGYGWTVGYQDASVEESRDPGLGWQLNEYPSGPMGLIPNYCVEPQSPTPVVSVKLPTGEVERFEVAASPQCNQAVPILDVNLAFNPIGDNQSTLVALNEQNGRLINGNISDISSTVPLNPSRYQLTTRSGYIYTLDESFGIETVIDPNGHTLTYSDSGIVHSSGKSVDFIRDAQGRIEEVRDPAGNAIIYDYDSNGDLYTVTERDGAVTTHSYYGSNCSTASATADCHLVNEILDPLGRRVVRNLYDDDGRLRGQLDENGIEKLFDHDIDARTSLVTDRDGRSTLFIYDDRGNVTSETQIIGDGSYLTDIVTNYTFDANDNQETKTIGASTWTTLHDLENNVRESRNPEGESVFYDNYNSRGQEGRITDERGHVYDMEYDIAGNLYQLEAPEVTDPDTGETSRPIAGNVINSRGLVESTTDLRGLTTTYTYYTSGPARDQKHTESNAVIGTITYTYDVNNNVETETRQRTVNGVVTNETTTYDYDERNRLERTTYPDGTYTQTEYDLAGNVERSRDRFGTWTDTDYDVYGRLRLTTYADGTSEARTYTDEGLLETVTDRSGRVTRNEYDDAGRLWRVHNDSDNTFTETRYTEQGWVRQEYDQNRNLTEYEYDLAGRRERVIRHIDGGTQEHQFTYYPNGELHTETDALGHTTTYILNELDQRINTQYHNGTSMQDRFDFMGARTQSTDQESRSTRFVYDDLGRLTSTTPEVSIDGIAVPDTLYSYDEVGNRLTQTDAENRQTIWTYDFFGRVRTRTLPEGMSESVVYTDGQGCAPNAGSACVATASPRTMVRTDFNGDTITTAYDVMGRTITVDYSKDGNSEVYTYYNNDQVHTVTDQHGTTTYTYDVNHRLETETRPDGTVMTYDYDDVGNRNLVSVTRNGVLSSSTTYTHDELNRLETVTDSSGITTYTYDDVGNMDTVTYPNGLVTDYDYNTINQLTDVFTRDGLGTLIEHFNYQLTPTGRREVITELDGRTTAYCYDNLYRLSDEVVFDSLTSPLASGCVSDTTGASYIAHYEYDWVGNRSSETVDGVSTNYTYDDNDRLTQMGGTTYGYDANGNTETETLDGVVKTYTWDGKNKLIQQDAAGVVSSYTYNHNGVRNSKTENGVTIAFVVDENRDYAQVLEDVVNDVATAQYTYGHDLIRQERSGVDNYYHYDGLGSTRALSDASGSLTDTYDYEAFGEVLNQTGSTENNYLFTGEQFDGGLNQYYLRARYYNQANGRFTQMDTWMGRNQDPVTLHKYLYAHADPGNMIDPSGNFSIGGLMTAVNVAATLTTVAQSSYELFGSVGEGGGDVSATQVGMVALASLGGIKLFKIVGKKFLKKYNCGKPGEHKICKMFQSDEKRIRVLRSTLGLGPGQRNVAFADYITSSGVGSIAAVSGPTLPGTAGMPVSIQTGWDGHSRRFDAEVKIYSTLYSRFNSATKGIVRVVSELKFCRSCSRVGRVFNGRHSGIVLLTKHVSSSTTHRRR